MLRTRPRSPRNVFVVLFEVMPKADRWEAYFEAAKTLRPELERVPGFIDNVRYRSLTRDGVVLSLSTWASEKALIRWRTVALHHGMQELGRNTIFADYRLRVAAVVADSLDPGGAEALRTDGTETGDDPFVVVSQGAAARGAEGERFAGVIDPADEIVVRGTSSGAVPEGAGGAERIRVAQVIRRYGMRDRLEAPQYYPPAPPE